MSLGSLSSRGNSLITHLFLCISKLFWLFAKTNAPIWQQSCFWKQSWNNGGWTRAWNRQDDAHVSIFMCAPRQSYYFCKSLYIPVDFFFSTKAASNLCRNICSFIFPTFYALNCILLRKKLNELLRSYDFKVWTQATFKSWYLCMTFNTLF